MSTYSAEIAVIGAGVVGLAVAAELSRNRSVVILEAHSKFGQETSSRNSEVVHSGIYYPLASKKTEFALRGRELIYSYCHRKQIPFRKCGKFVVATNSAEQSYLEGLSQHAAYLQIPVRRLAGAQISTLEPQVFAVSGLFFPESGIVNSHELMASLEKDFIENDGTLGYRCQVVEVYPQEGRWAIEFKNGEERAKLVVDYVVNCAGLAAADLSRMALKSKQYEHRFYRGRYFNLAAKYQNKFRSLVYPVPEKHGLGVHVTLDTQGMVRLGPDVDWCEDSQYENRAKYYDCSWDELRATFLQSVRRFCPKIQAEDLTPGTIGIRPKLFVDGVARPDFLIEEENNWIHCLGIESPGLTAALAISEEVSRMLRGRL